MRKVFILLTVHSYWSDLKGTKRQAKFVVWISYSKIALKQEIFESAHSNIRGKKILAGVKGKKEAMKACKKLPARNDQGNYPACFLFDLAGLHWKEPGTEQIRILWGPSMEKVPEKAADPSFQMNPDIIA